MTRPGNSTDASPPGRYRSAPRGPATPSRRGLAKATPACALSMRNPDSGPLFGDATLASAAHTP